MTPRRLSKAVILARGLGTRMRRTAADGPALDARQARAADAGLKGMIPIGRPFLDFVLTALADAGLCEVCLVTGPEHDSVRDYYARGLALSRLRLSFAIQESPLGTADAVAAAEAFAGGDEFLVINSDNFYPVSVLEAVGRLAGPGLAGFERSGLVELGNVDDERVRGYAVLDVDGWGYLRGIIEKPDAETWARFGGDALVSVNCWRFGPRIFEAARRVVPSVRGELELADAVRGAMALGERFEVVPVRAGVLDLSTRADIPSVAQRLAGMEVRI